VTAPPAIGMPIFAILTTIGPAVFLSILPPVGPPVFLPVERRVAAAALSERQLAEGNGHEPRKNIRKCLAHHLLLEFPLGGDWRRSGAKPVPDGLWG
jgi:hypothetical protein